jgi:hypothetical protein
MKSRRTLEKTANSIASMDRSELTRKIKRFNGRIRLDFSEDYLQKASTERLRHILLAAQINARN